jgi:hypothetical protein
MNLNNTLKLIFLFVLCGLFGKPITISATVISGLFSSDQLKTKK